MTRLRSCPSKPTLIATGGKLKQNALKLWDLETEKQLFTAKNVPPTELQLEVPVWESDISFIDEQSLATCSRHGYLRLYDTRSQRRPVAGFTSTDRDQFSFTSMVTHGMNAFVGLTMGGIQCYDLRSLKRPNHVYKGATGSVSDLCLVGDYLVSSSLDRFVRIHSTKTNALLYQSYAQSRVERILCDDIPKDKNGKEAEIDQILNELPVSG